MTDGPVETIVHQVHRLSVDVGVSFYDFRARYEQAVPVFDAARLAKVTDWDTVLQVASETAPNGFFVYWQADVTPLMRLAGDQSRCVEYLMGNHTIAQRMFHHDPAVMLYAPLRTAIYQDAQGRPGSRSTSPARGSSASAIRRSPRWASNWTVSWPLSTPAEGAGAADTRDRKPTMPTYRS